MDSPDHTIKNRVIQSPYIWSFTTYFTQGFPYTIIRQVSSLFFRDKGATLESIGLTSLFALPWTLKFLWGPFIDNFGTKRSWILIIQGILIGLFAAITLAASTTHGVVVIAGLFFFGSFLAATHDIAIDGYYLEALDTNDQAKFVGYRVMAYRIAMITGMGAVISIGTLFNWPVAFLSATVIFGLFFCYHLFFLPHVEQQLHPLSQLFGAFTRFKVIRGTILFCVLIAGIKTFYDSKYSSQWKELIPALQKISLAQWIGIFLFLCLLILVLLRKKIHRFMLKDPDSFYTKAFVSFIDREKIGIIFTAIILLRTGEYMLSTMVAPFFVDLGIKVHYGWISSFIGLPFSIIGALVGGMMISKYGLKKVLWPFLFLQNFTNLIYMALALNLQTFITVNTAASTIQPLGAANLSLIVTVHAFDQFSGGLGTSVLMTFLMRLCQKEFKAAHYAIGTGFMNISNVVVGVMSGFLCSWVGYGYFFGISFLLSVPGMVAVIFLPDDIFHKKTQ